jgi:hypothetical protein
MYFVHIKCDYTLKEIADHGEIHYSMVSKIRKEIEGNYHFKT